NTRTPNPNPRLLESDIELEKIKDTFDLNIIRIKDKFLVIEALSQYSSNNISEAEVQRIDNAIKDIMRSQIALLMSTLDFYFHELVKYGILQMFKGEKSETKSYKNFSISISCVKQALENPESVDWLEEFIIAKHKGLTIMSESKIKEAIALISSQKIYTDVMKKLEEDYTNPKGMLKELYKRRNYIVHQSDRDEISRDVYDITKAETEKNINFIISFIEEVHEKIKLDM
ncbi:HEPN domain-containing protein, partial [Turicibacter sanguinis]